MAFAIAITACLPAGFAGGVNLKIDVLARWLSGRLEAWLDAIGAFALLVFVALLAQQVLIHADNLAREGRTTIILGWPQAPFMYMVVLLLAFSTLVQAVVTLNSVRRAIACRDEETGVNRVVRWIAIGLAVCVVGIAIYGAVNFAGLSGWASKNPGSTVAIAFAALWCLMLSLMPLAAVTGLIGIVGCSLFIGVAPAMSAFATEATGLLTNSQLATLPLFLMMGSFAAVAGLADGPLPAVARSVRALARRARLRDDRQLRRIWRAHGLVACDRGDHWARRDTGDGIARLFARARDRSVRGGRDARPIGSTWLRAADLVCSAHRGLDRPAVCRVGWSGCSGSPALFPDSHGLRPPGAPVRSGRACRNGFRRTIRGGAPMHRRGRSCLRRDGWPLLRHLYRHRIGRRRRHGRVCLRGLARPSQSRFIFRRDG